MYKYTPRNNCRARNTENTLNAFYSVGVGNIYFMFKRLSRRNHQFHGHVKQQRRIRQKY